jgi:DNA polymerase I-like protein with 3'-5' exonuclease and polymerase domains
LLRAAVAFVPQSTVGDLLNLGLVKAHSNLPDMWHFILQVHDAVIMEVPKETPPEHISKFIHHYFEFPIQVNGSSLIIPIDIKVGLNWGQMYKLGV